MIVSIISMPATVAPASLPESLSCTLVIFTRFLEMSRDRLRLMTMDATPMSVSSTLYRNITIR